MSGWGASIETPALNVAASNDWEPAGGDKDSWETDGLRDVTNSGSSTQVNGHAFKANNSIDVNGSGTGGNPEWYSKHADVTEFQGGKDVTCRNCGVAGHYSRDCPGEKSNTGECYNCGEQGHNKADCPNPRSGGGGLTGECFNCGEVGHNKADCPNPKVDRPFTGTCRLCNEEGHRANECPTAPPQICNLCGENGHKAVACENPRPIDYSEVPDMSVEEAWAALKSVHDDPAANRDDFAEKIKILCKADRALTWVDVEKQLRQHKLHKYFVIAYEREPNFECTFVNLQGKIDCKHEVIFNNGFKPIIRASMRSWPKSPWENLERLADAGVQMKLGIPVCKRCKERGHTMKFCKEDKLEEIKEAKLCENCKGEGHRARECTEPLRDRSAAKTCRRCGGTGHKASDCTEPENLDNVECRKCNQTGHYAKDCPNGGGGGACRNCGQEGHMARDCDQPRVMKCRNCDELGHMSKECPKPTDWSRVKCTNCEQFGHSYRRCKAPPKESEETDFDNPSGGNDSFAAGIGRATDNDTKVSTDVQGDWDSTPTATSHAAAGGSWDSGTGW